MLDVFNRQLGKEKPEPGKFVLIERNCLDFIIADARQGIMKGRFNLLTNKT